MFAIVRGNNQLTNVRNRVSFDITSLEKSQNH